MGRADNEQAAIFFESVTTLALADFMSRESKEGLWPRLFAKRWEWFF